MNGFGGYVLSVTAAAVTAAIVLSLAGQGTMGKPVKLLAGIFMTLAVASPLVKLELPDPEQWYADYASDGLAAAAAGEALAEETVHAFIKSRVEAYIQDKALRYGGTITAEVSLDDAGIPTGVTISGEVSPYARARLAQIIMTDLGIGEEAQQWPG